MTGTPDVASRRAWPALAVLALPTLLLSLDISVLYLALPRLSAALGASGTQQLWIMDVYTFLLAGCLVPMGALGDRVGRRRLLLVGAAAFGATSLAAAYSPTPEHLVAARALMGVAAATLMPSTLALISTLFRDPRQRSTAIGIWAGCVMVGAALGPVVGGLLLEVFWWGSAFLLGVPVMVLLLVLGPILLPESRDVRAGRVDLPSVVLVLATVLPAVHAMKTVAADGSPAAAWAAAAVAATAGTALVRRQRHLDAPLVDLALFRIPAAAGALAVLLLGGILLAGLFLLVSQYLQLVAALDPAVAGLALAPVGLSVAVGAVAAPALARRVHPGVVIAGGLLLSASRCLVLARTGPDTAVAWLLAGTVVVYLGVGPSTALGTELVVGAAPPHRAGATAAVSESAVELSSALGVAVVGSLSAAVYRAEIALPADLSAPQAHRATDSIAGAVVFTGLAALAVTTLRRTAPARGPGRTG